MTIVDVIQDSGDFHRYSLRALGSHGAQEHLECLLIIDTDQSPFQPAQNLGWFYSLCYSEGGEGLTGTAGHDQLAPVMLLETGDDIVKSLLLMGSETEGVGPVDQIFRPTSDEIGPIDQTAGQIAKKSRASSRRCWYYTRNPLWPRKCFR